MTDNRPTIDSTTERSGLRRRPLLATLGMGITAGLAGCFGDDEEAPPDDGDDADDEDPDDADDEDPDDADDEDPDDADDEDPDDADDEDPDDDPEEDEDRATLESVSADEDFWDADPPTFSGEESAMEEVSLADGFTVFSYSHEGDGAFVVEILQEPAEEENGEEEEEEEEEDEPELESVGTPVVDTGETEGLRGRGITSGEYTLDVQADGNWELTVAQPQPMEDQTHEPPAEASGSDSDIVGPLDLAGGETVTGTHDGAGNFVVEAWMVTALGFDDLSIWKNVSGEYEGEATNEVEGLVWVAVLADGDWTIDIA